jgi:hypothetical protein
MPESLKKFSAAVIEDLKKALNSQPTEDSSKNESRCR